MKVEKVSQNLTHPNLKTQISYQPRFTGASVKEISKATDEFMPRIIKWLKKIEANRGEAQDIIINSVGTGLVAPIFIKYNFLSKTDEDTRTYSAWRQPISAVLAILTQAGVTIPFNMYLDKKFNNGEAGLRYNRTPFMDKKYVERIMKKIYPYATKTEITKKTEAYMKKQALALEKNVAQNKIIFKVNKDGKTSLHTMPKKQFDELSHLTIDRIIDGNKEEIKRCLEEKIPLKTARGEYFRLHGAEADELMTAIQKELSKAKDPKTFRKYLKGVIKDLKKNKKDNELIKQVKEIYEHGIAKVDEKRKITLINVLKDKVAHVRENIKFYSNVGSKEELVQKVEEYTARRITKLEKEGAVLTKIKEMITQNKTVQEIDNYIKHCVKNADAFGIEPEKLSNINFKNELIDIFQTKVKSSIKANKRIAGLIVALCMLPITCTLLNWIYPRLMDALFPNLSAKKHSKVVGDLINKANNQKAEVK